MADAKQEAAEKPSANTAEATPAQVFIASPEFATEWRKTFSAFSAENAANLGGDFAHSPKLTNLEPQKDHESPQANKGVPAIFEKANEALASSSHSDTVALATSTGQNILHGFELIDHQSPSATTQLHDMASIVGMKAGNATEITGLVAVAAWEGGKDMGKSIGHWVADHPKTAIAIGVGLVAVAEVATLGAATPAIATGLATLGTVADIGGTVIALGMTAKSAIDVAQHGDIQKLWNQQQYSKGEVDAARKGFVNDTKDAAFVDATMGFSYGVRALGGLVKDVPRGRYPERIVRDGKVDVGTGDWGKANLANGETITTQHLGPCVGVVSDNGAMAHLNPDTEGPKQIREFVNWLKANKGSSEGNIALAGGMDFKGHSYLKFNSSADLVNFLKTELKNAGFNIKFEDLYGTRQRQLILDSKGNLNIFDGWNDDYHKFFTFGS